MEDAGLVARLARTVRQFGVMRALYDLSLRALNRLVYFRVLKAVDIHTPDPKALERRPEYTYGFLSRVLVLAFALDPQYEMSERFLREALAKGDRCYGIVHGETLASYGWYSTKPTVALTADLELRFDPSYVYMYKGFTHEGYRGRRLHAAGMAHALQEYRTEGSKGIVSYVESNNFSSLKSCYRMGYTTFGHVLVLRIGGRYFIGASEACRAHGFALAPVVRSS
jgi:hypothetical protein